MPRDQLVRVELVEAREREPGRIDARRARAAVGRLRVAAQRAGGDQRGPPRAARHPRAEPRRLLVAERRQAIVVGRVEARLRMANQQQLGHRAPPAASITRRQRSPR